MKNKFAVLTIGILLIIGTAFAFGGDVYKDGIRYNGVAIVSPIDPENGNLDVNVSDQHTRTLDALFTQSITGGNFTLLSDTQESGIDAASLVYSFTVNPGHTLIVGDELLLLETSTERSFYAIVVGVLGDIITVDRPIDAVFSAATTLGREVTTEMAVDGSVTPQIFSIRSGSTPTDITRLLVKIVDNTSMDVAKFGGISALSNGVVLRVLDSYQETIFNFKTNGDIQQFCYDVDYSLKSPSGSYGLGARITFGGQSKHGVVLRIAENDVVQIVIQDDLTGLDSFKIAAEGHLTQGEI